MTTCIRSRLSPSLSIDKRKKGQERRSSHWNRTEILSCKEYSRNHNNEGEKGNLSGRDIFLVYLSIVFLLCLSLLILLPAFTCLPQIHFLPSSLMSFRILGSRFDSVGHADFFSPYFPIVILTWENYMLQLINNNNIRFLEKLGDFLRKCGARLKFPVSVMKWRALLDLMMMTLIKRWQPQPRCPIDTNWYL